jgi:hypothetical protein
MPPVRNRCLGPVFSGIPAAVGRGGYLYYMKLRLIVSKGGLKGECGGRAGGSKDFDKRKKIRQCIDGMIEVVKNGWGEFDPEMAI